MIYCFDLDGTLCTQSHDSRSGKRGYLDAQPLVDEIREVNRLYELGHRIIIWTARGNSSGTDWKEATRNQLADWGVHYHELQVGTKVGADLYIDDRGQSAEEWRRTFQGRKTGFIAGSFDLLHPGYIQALQVAKQHCTYLVVGLHEDPATERPHKNSPVIPLRYREAALRECRSVDDVLAYRSEQDLVDLLRTVQPQVRFLGDDAIGVVLTGGELNIPIVYLSRDHGYSMTRVRDEIAASRVQATRSGENSL